MRLARCSARKQEPRFVRPRAKRYDFGERWPIPWIASGVVDDYDRAQSVVGFALDVLLWFWIVSIPQMVGAGVRRLIGALRWRRLRWRQEIEDPP